MLEQPDQSILIPFLKIVVDDLSDFGVVCELGVQRFAHDGVDVSDELVLDSRADYFGAHEACAACYDDFHACWMLLW